MSSVLTLNGGVLVSNGVAVSHEGETYPDGDSVGWGTSVYTVTINLTNPELSNYFRDFKIIEQYTDEWNQPFPAGYGGLIGSISSPTGSTSVTIPVTSYGFECEVGGNGPGEASIAYATKTCTGGVEYVGAINNDVSSAVFHVTGNGTITISGIEWDDD